MPETMKLKMMKLRAMKKDSARTTRVPAGFHMMPDGRLMRNGVHRRY
jgi:hypothetical protein